MLQSYTKILNEGGSIIGTGNLTYRNYRIFLLLASP